MHQFDTRHAEFDGFSDFYNREVFPVLEERDSVRASAVKKGLISAAISTVFFAACAGFIFWYWQNLPAAFFVLALAGMSGFAAFGFMTNDIREETKDRIVQAIVGYVGWSFDSVVNSFDMTPFRDLFLLPKKVDRSSFEDTLSGQAHGTSFHSVEAKLENETRDSEGKTSWKTVFQGQLMTLDFPTTTFGRTIVLRDQGWFNPKKQADMKRVGLVDPVFEKIFEAYGTDQVEARVILDPAFMQKMVDLENAVSGKNIRFGFDAGKLYIAVETKNQYEAGSMFKSLTTPDRTQKILDEVAAVFDIVDTLLKRESRKALPY